MEHTLCYRVKIGAHFWSALSFWYLSSKNSLPLRKCTLLLPSHDTTCRNSLGAITSAPQLSWTPDLALLRRSRGDDISLPKRPIIPKLREQYASFCHTNYVNKSLHLAPKHARYFSAGIILSEKRTFSRESSLLKKMWALREVGEIFSHVTRLYQSLENDENIWLGHKPGYFYSKEGSKVFQ